MGLEHSGSIHSVCTTNLIPRTMFFKSKGLLLAPERILPTRVDFAYRDLFALHGIRSQTTIIQQSSRKFNLQIVQPFLHNSCEYSNTFQYLVYIKILTLQRQCLPRCDKRTSLSTQVSRINESSLKLLVSSRQFRILYSDVVRICVDLVNPWSRGRWKVFGWARVGMSWNSSGMKAVE